MGVYNPKKKMPTSCYMCWDSLYCEYKIKNPVKMAQGRADDCPLIEIPTPHGRLIEEHYHGELKAKQAEGIFVMYRSADEDTDRFILEEEK